jgi:hypothetical protein
MILVDPSGIGCWSAESFNQNKFSCCTIMTNRLVEFEPSLELCIRTALTLNELMPGTERYIQSVVQQTALSQRDRALLDLLYDALQDGCIRRVDEQKG